MEFHINTFLICLVLLVAILQSIQALSDFGPGPLLTGATSFSFTISTTTLIKPTPCFTAPNNVTQCRRKRGLEEKPEIIQFDHFELAPSAVVG